MTWWLETEIFLWVVVSKGFTFTNLHTCPIPIKWSFLIPVVKRHSQCNRRFTHLQIFPYSLRSCLWFPVVDNTFTFTDLHTCPIPMRWSFWIPVVKRAFTLQQKIYTFTNISLFFEVMFLIPCSGQHIYIYAFTQMSNTYFVIFLNPCSTEHLHCNRRFTIYRITNIF